MRMWNHRILGFSGEPWFAIMETHYNDDGSVAGFTEPCLGSENPDALITLLERIIADLKANPKLLRESDRVGFSDGEIPF